MEYLVKKRYLRNDFIYISVPSEKTVEEIRLHLILAVC